MSTINFNTRNLGTISLTLEESEFWGRGLGDPRRKISAQSWIEMPVKIQRSPGQGASGLSGQLLSFGGVIYLTRNPDTIAGWFEETKPPNCHITEQQQSLIVRLPLTHTQIEAIEAYRDTKVLNLHLGITCVISVFQQTGLREIENIYIDGNIKVPRSIWTDQVLPYMNYCAVQVIEIPIPEEPQGEPFLAASKALQEAQTHYMKDYVTCVEECRKVLQPLVDSVKPSDVESLGEKDSGPARLKFYANTNLKPLIGENWAKALGETMGALWSMTSKHHHASPYTARHDAAVVMHLGSALLSYVASLANIKEVK